jgi:hypothetical protein
MQLLPTAWGPNPGVQPAAVAAPANGASSMPPNTLRRFKLAATTLDFSNIAHSLKSAPVLALAIGLEDLID